MDVHKCVHIFMCVVRRMTYKSAYEHFQTTQPTQIRPPQHTQISPLIYTQDGVRCTPRVYSTLFAACASARNPLVLQELVNEVFDHMQQSMVLTNTHDQQSNRSRGQHHRGTQTQRYGVMMMHVLVGAVLRMMC